MIRNAVSQKQGQDAIELAGIANPFQAAFAFVSLIVENLWKPVCKCVKVFTNLSFFMVGRLPCNNRERN